MGRQQTLIAKINALSSERLSEVEAFVDSLARSENDRLIVRHNAQSSEASFKAVWDNDSDAAYDAI
jgi:hypothetical protein